MPNKYLQLSLLTLFTLVLTIRYIVSLAKGQRPVLLLKKDKTAKERLVLAIPVTSVAVTALLILRQTFTPHIGTFLAAGFRLPVWLQWTGFVISGLSFVLLISAYWSLGNNWRVGTGDEHVEKLVNTGVFHYTRNPVYLFFNLYLTGLFLLNGHFIMLALLFLVMVTLHLLIAEEEAFLERRFGIIYQQYKKKTPRYF
jgi:protein-S-isoprenylcysteine O-methyltransferase Ste14